MNSKNMRWVIAHDPYELFLKSAQQFAEEVKTNTNGEYQIEILSLKEYADKYNDGVALQKQDVPSLMEQGRCELSQLFSFILGAYNNDLWSLEMPYIFESHDHADAIFEGPIGAKMLEDLSAKSCMRGLSYTYSGGYKCIPSNKSIRTIEDFAGLRVRTSGYPVSMDIFESVGAIPVADPIENTVKAAAEGKYDGGESSYVRVFGSQHYPAFSQVNDSEHSLLVTNIIVANKVWDSLPVDIQAIFKTAAINAGRAERIESVELGEEVKERCLAESVPLTIMEESERARFKQATEWMYDKYAKVFSPGLLDDIKKAH